jgi:hypothetical protein
MSLPRAAPLTTALDARRQIVRTAREARGLATARPRPRLEKAEQADVLRVLQALGAQVWLTGTRRPHGESHSTRMTPGLPDLLVFLPARGGAPARFVTMELKRTGGSMSVEQQRFKGCCDATGIAHVCGDASTIVDWLETAGYLTKRT